MKLKKLKTFLILFWPFILIYLLFWFYYLSLDFTIWSRISFIFVVTSIYTFYSIWLIWTISDKEFFYYDKFKKIEKQNEEIKRLNELSKTQLELLKENAKYKEEAKKYY